ncbi:unnamed protein product [Lactuca virosa]|uniref:Uncharacterized protein n=1 Tax=Lactuca virosa TaxID=75947 RepID=A0AAU9NJ90_9ASTR|nr:unnamed protein product [Lactuca virosa]
MEEGSDGNNDGGGFSSLRRGAIWLKTGGDGRGIERSTCEHKLRLRSLTIASVRSWEPSDKADLNKTKINK